MARRICSLAPFLILLIVLSAAVSGCGSDSQPSQLGQVTEPISGKLTRVGQAYSEAMQAVGPGLQVLDSLAGAAATSSVVQQYQSTKQQLETALPLMEECSSVAISVAGTFKSAGRIEGLSKDDVIALSAVSDYFSAVSTAATQIYGVLDTLSHFFGAYVAGGKVAALSTSNLEYEYETAARTQSQEATPADFQSWKDNCHELLAALDAVKVELEELQTLVPSQEVTALLVQTEQTKLIYENKSEIAEAILAGDTDALKVALAESEELQKSGGSRAFDIMTLAPALNSAFGKADTGWREVAVKSEAIKKLPSEQRDLLTPYLLQEDE